MIVRVATILDATVDIVWRQVQTSRLLTYVASPLQVFRPLDPPAFPEIWSPGRYRARLLSFGIVPTGWQDIVISYPVPTRAHEQLLRDDGSGSFIKRWDHLITVAPRADGRTDYADEIAIEAGLLTGAVAAYAKLFYRHRQRRWHRLIKGGFDYAR